MIRKYRDHTLYAERNGNRLIHIILTDPDGHQLVNERATKFTFVQDAIDHLKEKVDALLNAKIEP